MSVFKAIVAALFTTSATQALLHGHAPAMTATVEPLHIFPNGTAGENLYIRSDGSVLMTMIFPAAELYYFASPTSEPMLLHNFTNSAAAYGITEFAHDQFAVLTSTFSRTGLVTNATGHVWRIDLSTFETVNGSITSPAIVSRLSTISNCGFLNGAASLNDNTILAADSVLGVIYAVDTQLGNYTVALNDTALSPNASGAVRLGVNGLQNVNGTLYYTNTNKRTVGKVALHANGSAAGPFETIASHILVDDLDVDASDGAVYIPSLVANEIQYVAPGGDVSQLVGSLNSTDVPGPTAIKIWEQSQNDQGTSTELLISTSGGIEYPINGTYIMGGGLYRLVVQVSESR